MAREITTKSTGIDCWAYLIEKARETEDSEIIKSVYWRVLFENFDCAPIEFLEQVMKYAFSENEWGHDEVGDLF